MFITAFRKVHHWIYSEPSKCSPYLSCFIKVRFNLVRIFPSRSSKLSSSLLFCHHYFERICSHACYICPAHLIPSVVYPNNNSWWHKIAKLPILQFMLGSFYFFSPVVPKPYCSVTSIYLLLFKHHTFMMVSCNTEVSEASLWLSSELTVN